MKRVITLILCLMLCSLMLAACSDDDNSHIVGVWKVDRWEIGGDSIKVIDDRLRATYNFKKNGTVETTALGIITKSTFKVADNSIEIKHDNGRTYTIEISADGKELVIEREEGRKDILIRQ